MADQDPQPQPQNPNANPNPNDRDFLLHLESYLARRDGVDKLLKISRYTSKLLLSSSLPLPETLTGNLHSFESSVGQSRKAFRLGKFVQDLNSLRFSDLDLLSLLAYGGEGIYYFIEQIVWLSKSGLISSNYSKRLSKISAWAELIGYVGSISIKVRDLMELGLKLEDTNDEKRRLLKEKILMKRLSIIQDLADVLMALGDVRDGKGVGTSKSLMASAGLVSAVISTHKNWKSC